MRSRSPASIMQAKLPVRLTVLIPAVENAVSAEAYRPGEVIRTRAGITVEVDNTDAEGRLVLCDALAYAVEKKPDLIVDFATLTGAARVALGPDLPALFANRDELANAVLASGVRARRIRYGACHCGSRTCACSIRPSPTSPMPGLRAMPVR